MASGFFVPSLSEHSLNFIPPGNNETNERRKKDKGTKERPKEKQNRKKMEQKKKRQEKKKGDYLKRRN